MIKSCYKNLSEMIYIESVLYDMYVMLHII